MNENSKTVTFEIENYGGNTILSFIFNKETNEIVATKNCVLADIDGDYIFDTDNLNFRIQED